MDAANIIPVSSFLPSADHLAATSRPDAQLENSQAEKVAQDFESIFISLLLKEMRNTLDTEHGGLFGSEGSDTLGGMFDLFMGQHLAKAQSFGISDAIKNYLAQVPAESDPKTGTTGQV